MATYYFDDDKAQAADSTWNPWIGCTRALGVSRRKAAARTRRKRSFVERSRSLVETPSVVICDEVAK